MSENSLESVLREYFSPSETKKAKGESKFVIVINGKTITTRIKSRKDLDKALRSIALKDATNGTTTKVLVYKLEGEADVKFESTVNVTAPASDEPTEGE